MKPRADIKTRARATFKERGNVVIFAGLIFVIFDILQIYLPRLIARMNPAVYYVMRNGVRMIHPSITFSFTLVSLFVMMPLGVGYAAFCIRTYRGETSSVAEMFHDGFAQYSRNLGGMLRVVLFVVLWSLLLIIPGIVKAVAYSMTKYILAENEHIGGKKAIQLSMRITDGRRMDIFVFFLSFIGWAILTGITLGLLGIYTTPYVNTSIAGLYHELKQEAIARGAVSEEDFS